MSSGKPRGSATLSRIPPAALRGCAVPSPLWLPGLRSRPCRNLAVTRGQFATVGLGPRRCFAPALPRPVLQSRQRPAPLASRLRSSCFPSGSAAASPLRHSAYPRPMACGSQSATLSGADIRHTLSTVVKRQSDSPASYITLNYVLRPSGSSSAHAHIIRHYAKCRAGRD